MQSMAGLSMPVAIEWPEGLGISMSTIAKICRESGRHDVLLAIEEVDRREHGGDRKSDRIKNAVGILDSDVSWKSSGKLLSRLKQQQLALLDAVLSGDKTIHAACVEACFRRKELNPLNERIDHNRKQIHSTSTFAQKMVNALVERIDHSRAFQTRMNQYYQW
jgi:hypothetical protein